MTGWVPQFYPSSDTGVKVMCTTCGRSGSDLRGPNGELPPKWKRSWMSDCLFPHTFKCTCGKAYPKRLGLVNHIGKMKNPTGHAIKEDR